MAFRLFKKSDLIAAVIVFGCMAALFLLAAVFADAFGGHITVNGVTLQKSDPDYAHKVRLWRVGLSVGGLFCILLSWLSFRGIRKISD